jgi:GT2 family glycosyltransferase
VCNLPLASVAPNALESPTLGVSLVLYKNPPDMVRGVLESLRATPCDVRICVVDNSPTPHLRDTVDRFGATYIHDESNPGFGASHNRAWRSLPPTEFHLIVNPDIYFESESLLSLMEFLREERRVGIAAPRVLYPSGELQHLCKRYPSVLVLFGRRFVPRWLHWLLRKPLERFEMRDVGYDQMMDVPHASGCFMLFRRSVLEEIGGFDPKFFLYFEDADISFRVAKSGYRVVYYPKAHVFHCWARGSHTNWRLTWASIRSSIYLFRKHGWKFL